MKPPERNKYLKLLWLPEHEAFIRENWHHTTNQQLADALGVKLTKCREKCYQMGLYRMKLHRWTPKEVAYLKENWQTKGDTELAQELQKRWPKKKGWSKKHVEKKRRYLKLKRTNAMRKAIHARNVSLGMFADCPVKAWKTRGGAAPEGEIRLWNRNYQYPILVVKHQGKWIHHNPWLWEQHFGPVPPGLLVRTDVKPPQIPKPQDLYLLTREEHAKLNRRGYMALPDSMKETIRLTNKLIKAIKDE